MKRFTKILCTTLALILCVGFVSAFAEGSPTILDNDKFYAEIPAEYKKGEYGEAYYTFENENIETVDIIVDGNIICPEGIKNMSDETISERYTRYYGSIWSEEIEVTDVLKERINGLAAYRISGTTYSIFTYYFCTYIFATEENVYIFKFESDSLENTSSEKLKPIVESFIPNGTPFPGDKLLKNHDFSKSESYISALERDVLGQSNVEYNQSANSFASVVISLAFLCPLILIIFMVKYFKQRKMLKQYKELFGTLEDIRKAQRAYATGYNQPYENHNNNYGKPYGESNNFPAGENVNPPSAPDFQGNPYGSSPYGNYPYDNNSYGNNSYDNSSRNNNSYGNNVSPENRDTENKNNF